MSDSEDDYMSDAFLSKIEDTRPGLIKGKKAEKLMKEEKIMQKDREHREMQKNKFARKKIAELMVDIREEALATSMMVNEPENKGLAMMQKMGFKIGNGLGPDGEGRRNPVQIGEVKEDKKGIGNKTARQEKKINEERIKLINLKRKAEEQNTTKKFKNSTRQKNIENTLLKFIRKAQKSCYDLDSVESRPRKSDFFWPPGVVRALQTKKTRLIDQTDDSTFQNVFDEDDLDEFEPEKLILEITEYLRQEYFFCVYCAVKFNDAEDLEQNCAGNCHTLHDED